MAKEYLDKDGLSYFWAKIKNYVDSHSGGGLTIDDVYPIGSVYYTESRTADPNTLFGGTWVRAGVPLVIDEEISDGNNSWNYRKWSDGLLECWARFYISSMNISNTSGQLRYASVSISNQNYPIAFTNYPTVTVSGNVTGGNGWVVMDNTSYSATKVGAMYAYSSASRTGVGVTVNIRAVGMWSSSESTGYAWTRTA